MADGDAAVRSMLIKELCRMTREARALDLGTTVAVKHIDDVRRDLASFAHEHVGGGKPALIDGAAARWPAAKGWTPGALLERAGGALVTLAVTPDGRADAVRPVRCGCGEGGEEGEEEEHFVLPHEERVPLREFLRPDGSLVHRRRRPSADSAGAGEATAGGTGGGAVRYLGSQNGCLASELPDLLSDLLSDPEEDEELETEEEDDDEDEAAAAAAATAAAAGAATGADAATPSPAAPSADEARRRRRAAAGPAWARRAMAGGGRADAVNCWIGDAFSETSLHRDPYENLFVVLRGRKVFTLLPPHEAFRLGLEPFPVARWAPADGAAGADGAPLEAWGERPAREVLWTALDPTLGAGAERGAAAGRGADCARTGGGPARRRLLEEAQQQQRRRYPLYHDPGLPPAISVTVEAGQALYLPAFWWHHVRQDGGGGQEGGCCVGVNWWFDARFGAAFALGRLAERLAARAGALRPLGAAAAAGGGSGSESDEGGDGGEERTTGGG